MFKKFIFRHFGRFLNMGYVVAVTEIPLELDSEILHVEVGEGASSLGRTMLTDQIESSHLGAFLRRQGPYHLDFSLSSVWNNPNILDWFQTPDTKVQLVSIRLLNHPSWLPQATHATT